MGRKQTDRRLNRGTEGAVPRYTLARTHLRNIEKPGWVTIAAALILGMTAVNSGNNMLYFVEGIVLALILASGYLSRRGLRRMSMKIEPVLPLWARDLTKLRMQLTNKSRFFFILGLEIFLEWERLEPPGPPAPADRSAGYQLKNAVLAPRKSRRVNLAWSFPRRGRYRLARVSVGSSSPFGWFYRWGSFNPGYEVLVYPERWPDWDSHWLGAIESLRTRRLIRDPAGEDFYGLRDFQPGDAIRYIHWPTTARRGTWMVRQPARSLFPTTSVILDRRLAPEILEAALSWTATGLETLFQRMQAVRLVTQGLEPILVRRGAHLQAALRFLATCGPARGDLPPVDARASGFWISSRTHPPPANPGVEWIPAESLIFKSGRHHDAA